MVCDDNSRLLHGYLDAELDLVRSLEIEEHLKTCPDCAQQLWSQQTLRKAFRSSNLYERAPSGLAVRIRASISQEAAREGGTALQSKPIPMLLPRRKVWNWLAVAAAILLAALLTWRALPGGRGNSDLVAREIVASHIRSLQPGHLFDVQSTDQHTVKPWFNGKLDFSPEVKDFAAQGFPLIGGRLDYLMDRPVAALIYGRRQHIINVFTWPAGPEPISQSQFSRNGYNAIHWSHGSMTFWAVSDVGLPELAQFKDLYEK